MYGHGGVVIYCCLRGLCVFCVEREREDVDEGRRCGFVNIYRHCFSIYYQNKKPETRDGPKISS